MAIDINDAPIGGTIDNVLTTVEGVSGGVASEADSIGSAVGILIVIGIYLAVILAAIGVLYVILRLPKRIGTEIKGYKNM